MSNKQSSDIGKQIGDTVRTALESGDLTRLKNLGPAVQNAVKDIAQAAQQSIATGSPPQQGQGQKNHTYPVPGPQPTPPPTPAGYTAPPQPQAPARSQRGQTPAANKGWYSRSGSIRPSMPRSGYGVGSVVFGVMGMVAFGISAAIFGISALVAGVLGPLVYLAIGAGASFLLSIGLLGGGIGKQGLVKRLRRYFMLFGDSNHVLTIEEISKATGRSPAGVRKDIRKGIEKKILRDVQMDVMETCVIRGEDAYRLYVETEEARKQREAEEAERQRRMDDPSTAPIEIFREEGRATIRKIQAANKAIPSEEISQKLEKLENTTQRIFTYVEQHPEKLPDTRKFLNYYLPTTLKLVEKYRQYEEMDVRLENVVQAKADIAGTLDTIDLAFNNLLASLYREDTLDVVTDIEVLETMLEQEGLTGKKFEIEPD